jgi:hypothetical protein
MASRPRDALNARCPELGCGDGGYAGSPSAAPKSVRREVTSVKAQGLTGAVTVGDWVLGVACVVCTEVADRLFPHRV